MSDEGTLERSVLETHIDDALRVYQLHPEDDLLRDSFNSLQMLYHASFGCWYRPAVPVEIVSEQRYV